MNYFSKETKMLLLIFIIYRLVTPLRYQHIRSPIKDEEVIELLDDEEHIEYRYNEQVLKTGASLVDSYARKRKENESEELTSFDVLQRLPFQLFVEIE